MVKCFEFGTSQEAWEGINQYLANEDKEIKERGGGRYGPEIISYDHFIKMRTAWVDPDFDFGIKLGYTKSKWSSLVNNYIDIDHLDLVKSQVRERVAKKSKSYNISMLFDNSHNSGKGCLLALTFSKRVNLDHPILYFKLRASEVTKRLLFDLLLVQRIGEYVYGKDTHLEMNLLCGHMYLSAEAFSMFNNHGGIDKWLYNKGDWQEEIRSTLHKFQTTDPSTITFKVHRRCAEQLQFDKEGNPLSGKKSMLAGDLLFPIDSDIEYPEDCISAKARRAYKRKLGKR